MKDDFWGEPISIYTRKQALADGNLIDVSPLAKECGIKYPVAVTSGVWAECVSLAQADGTQDETGRLWDILFILRTAMGNVEGARVEFKVQVQNEKELVLHDLYAVVGPGDDMEPVITIMLMGED